MLRQLHQRITEALLGVGIHVPDITRIGWKSWGCATIEPSPLSIRIARFTASCISPSLSTPCPLYLLIGFFFHALRAI
jgi:hypothetical protein